MYICFKIICDPGEGRNRVLGHWACYKVETSTADEADTARQVHHCILCSLFSSNPIPETPRLRFYDSFLPTMHWPKIGENAYCVRCTLYRYFLNEIFRQWMHFETMIAAWRMTLKYAVETVRKRMLFFVLGELSSGPECRHLLQWRCWSGCRGRFEPISYLLLILSGA